MNKKRLLSQSCSDEEDQIIRNTIETTKKVCIQQKTQDLQVKEEDENSRKNSKTDIKLEEDSESEEYNSDNSDNEENSVDAKIEDQQEQQQQQQQQKEGAKQNLQLGLQKKQSSKSKVSEKQKMKHRQFLVQKAQKEAEIGDDLFKQMLQGSDGEDENESQSTTEKEVDSNYISEEQQKLNRQFLGDIKKFVHDRDASIVRQPDYRTQKIDSLTLFTLKCQKNHIWDSSFKILKHKWCPKCAIQFNQIRQYVQKLKGKMISQCLTSVIRVQCSKTHQFELQLKNYQDNWCTECFQQIMNQFQMPSDDEYSEHVKESAKAQAIEFIKKNANKFSIENDFGKISSAIYVNDIPSDIYINYLKGLNKEDLKRHKYTTQRNIHPDVNGHPCARNAFTKFSSIFETIQK